METSLRDSNAEATKIVSYLGSDSEILVFHAFIIPDMWEIHPKQPSIEIRGTISGSFDNYPVSIIRYVLPSCLYLCIYVNIYVYCICLK